MNTNSKILLGLVMAGLLTLVVSCGDDDGGTAPCTNCDFWGMAYGGVGRFPAASADPNIIAFSSRYQFPEKIQYPFDPGDLGVDQNYHIWLARIEGLGDQAVSDTVWYYQITTDTQDDFMPVWSPDGGLIAFERNVGQEDERQIFVVDVSDHENPGIPQQVTDEDLKPPNASAPTYRNVSPSWVALGGKTWLSFVNYPLGAGDFDMGLLSWDDLGDTVWVSIDPADFATDENSVMSYTFRDQQASSNGSRLIAFSSPDRQRVGDIRVLACTEEQPDSSVVTEIFVNGKTSEQFTPYTFHYRPAGIRVRISSMTEGYCTEAGDSLVPLPDTTNVFVIDFEHTRGTLGVAAAMGGLFIYLDGEELTGPDGLAVKTPSEPGEYVYIDCVMPDTQHEVYTMDVFGTRCGDVADVSVARGETTWVYFECESVRVNSREGSGRAELTGGVVRGRGAGGEAPLLTQQEVRGIWVVDTGEETSLDDDGMFLIDPGSPGANRPVLSPDGNYVAYFRGQYTSWEIVIADISDLISGTGDVVRHVVGLPGSGEDFECWRKPEAISWLSMQDEEKIVVSLSPCRGGEPDDFGIWVAEVSQFLR